MFVTERMAKYTGLAEKLKRNETSVVTRENAVRVAIVAIILLGGILRFSGRDWDQGQHLHPDERFITMVATDLRWPASIGEYFNSAESPLNPYNVKNDDDTNRYGSFIYGTFPLFLSKAVADITGKDNYGEFPLASRGLSATFDLITVFLVFVVGRRLFGDFAGLLASLLMSLSVLNIQLSHYGTFDTFVTMLCLATFYFAIRANDTGGWRSYTLAGIAAGLAIASKLSALPVIFMVGLPLAEAIRQRGWGSVLRRQEPRHLPPLVGVGLSVLAAIWTFRFTQPYSFLGPSPFSFSIDPRWTNDVDYWRKVQSGIADMPPSAQWAARTPMVFILENLVRWGLGVPLGIVALLALGLAGLRLATTRRWPPTWQVILVGWPAFHLVYYGMAFIKTMRYVLPAYPFLILLAAALLARFAARGSPTSWPLPFRWQIIPALFIVATTALYAIAFAGIYHRPVTRVSASAWFFENAEPGSVRTSVVWDDGLPMSLPGYPSPGDYPDESLDLYADDNPEKLASLIDSLDRTDYVIESSNRIYGSIPRLPEKYPMTSEYYRMLFSGELGFELVKTFTSHPSIFGISLNDDHAEEAFTVYDHPPVLIFKKTDAYDSAAVKSALAAKLTGDIVNLRPIQVGYNMLMMSDEERQVQQAGGTWSAIFDRDSLSNRHPVRVWYLALQLMALAAFPLCWRVLGGLPDRGYAVAKTIGLLIVGWFAWLLASLHLVDFGQTAVLVGIGATAVISALAVGTRFRSFVGDLRGRWREILVTEVVFLVAFFVFVWFRSINPDLWHPWRGGEKPMEFAYFNAVIRSTHFPPYDPWFAGGYINYYYFGYALLASVVRLTGIIPSVAFNLAVPTCFALLVVNSWSFVTGMVRLLAGELRIRSRWTPLVLGLFGPLFVAVLGNFDLARRIGVGDYGYPSVDSSGPFGAFGDVIRGTWRFLTEAVPLPSNAFWDPSRVIPDTINEFPYFTMLFADFHPHLIALPFTSAALLVALAVLLSRRWPTDAVEGAKVPIETDTQTFGLGSSWRDLRKAIPFGITFERVLLVGLTGLVTGVLFPLNTWDFPTYVAVTAGAFLLLEVASSAGRGSLLLSFATLRRTALWTVGTIVIGRVLFWPYFTNYANPGGGFVAWEGDLTTTSEYLIIHGIMLFFVVSFLLGELSATLPARFTWRTVQPTRLVWGYQGDDPTQRRLDASVRLEERTWSMRPIVWASTAVGVVLLLSIWRDKLLWMLGGLLLLTVVVAWRRREEPVRVFLLGMVVVALGLSIAVERYTLSNDIGRMNTVFKFYMQIWMLMALVAAVGLVLVLLRYQSAFTRSTRAVWATFGVIFIVAGLAYPIQATSARLDDRFNPLPRTLDGMAYMTSAVYEDGGLDGSGGTEYPLESDYEAIRWLQDNVQGSPVILEGNLTQLYRWGSRVSIYTGLPTVIGWDWHQTQQRSGYGQLIDQRKEDVERILDGGGSFDSITPLLDKYHVRYIYIGELERTYYSDFGLRKFALAATDGKLSVVYDADEVTIYEYIPTPDS